MKREGSPLRVSGPLSDPLKARESRAPAGKDVDCYIRLIPRDELRQPGKEGILAQVRARWRRPKQLSANIVTAVCVFRGHP